MEKNLRDDYYIQNMEENSEIDVLEIFEKLWKNKLIILIFVIVGLIVSTIGAKIYKNKSTITRSIISFNFEEIKEGKNPNGTPFNLNNILTNKNIKKAYEEYKTLTSKELTLTEFKSYLEVKPIIPEDISKLIVKSLKEGKKYNYTASEYFITLKRTAKLENEKKILEKLTRMTIEDYIAENMPVIKRSLIDSKKIFIDRFIYEDYLEIIKNRIEIIENDITYANNKKLNFNSVSFDYGYRDILLALNLIKKIDLNKVEAKLEKKYITSNIKKSDSVLRNILKKLDIEKEVLNKKLQVLKETIANYKLATKEILLTGNLNASTTEKDEHYSELIQDYIDTTTNVEENIQVAKKIEKKLQEMSKSTPEENKEVIDDFERIINSINVEIARLNNLNKNYYEVEYGNMVSQLSPVDSVYSGKPIILLVAIGTFMFLVLGCMVALLKIIVDEKKAGK